MIVQNPNFESEVRERLLAMPYLKWLGLSFVHIAPGEVDFNMPFRTEITFDGRIVQAAPIAALLDFAAGAAAFTLVAPGTFLATADFTVKLLAPALGERFIGRGRVISATRTTTVSQGNVFAYSTSSKAEKHVATGLVTMHTIPERQV